MIPPGCQYSKHTNGATLAGAEGYKTSAATVDDQHRYTQYDSYGHARRSIDAESKTTFYSYNAAGEAAKVWCPVRLSASLSPPPHRRFTRFFNKSSTVPRRFGTLSLSSLP